MNAELKSRAAREAREANYGGASYWTYLEDNANEMVARFRAKGDEANAERVLNRPLSEALAGNNGD